MATGKPLRTNLFIGGWTALAIWQRLRCTGRPRLDQPHTVANLLARAGIKAKSRVPFSGAPSCRDPWETILPAVEGVAGTLRSVSLKMPGIRSIPQGDADGIVAGLPYERPVDLLVDAPSRRRNSSSFHCRAWGRDLPPASFLMLAPHIYLAGPNSSSSNWRPSSRWSTLRFSDARSSASTRSTGWMYPVRCGAIR